jgi:hypothetical protein
MRLSCGNLFFLSYLGFDFNKEPRYVSEIKIYIVAREKGGKSGKMETVTRS